MVKRKLRKASSYGTDSAAPSDGLVVRNQILLSLPPSEYSPVFAELESVALPSHTPVGRNGGAGPIRLVLEQRFSVGFERHERWQERRGGAHREGRICRPTHRCRLTYERKPCSDAGSGVGTPHLPTQLVAIAVRVPPSGKEPESLRAGVGNAILPGGGLQPIARSREASGTLAAHESGPAWWRRGAADPGIPGTYVGHAAGECYRGCRSSSGCQPDQVHAGNNQRL